MKPEQDIDSGIIGAAHEAKSNLPYALMCWAIIAMVIVLVFDAGLLVGERNRDARLSDTLKKHEVVVRHETIDSVNRLAKNRARFELLRFRASEYGVSLEL